MRKPININPNNTLRHQYDFATAHPEVTPYPAIVGGYGSGKSMSVPLRWLYLIEYRASKGERCKLFVVEPTYKMVSMVMVKTFDKFFDTHGIKHHYHKTQHCYTIWYRKHRFECYFYSAERAESIAGINMTDCIIDEFDLIRTEEDQQNVYNQCLARLRESKHGSLGIVTTPEGFKYTYELYMQKHVGNPNYRMIKAKTTDNFFLPDSYIDGLRAQFDSLLIQRYLEGEFVNLNNMAAYYMFSRDKHLKPCKDSGAVPHVGIDFNINPLCSVVCNYKNGVASFFLEYHLNNCRTRELVDILRHDFEGRDIIAYPDPTGNHRETSADRSDHDILKNAGFDLRYNSKFTQRRKTNSVNNWFDKGKIEIDPSLANLIKDLEQVTIDSTGHIDKPANTMLTHISDAMANIISMLDYEENRPLERVI